MTLRLSVVSEHAIRLGQHSTKVFGVHGGTIGRGTDNAEATAQYRILAEFLKV